VIRYIVLKTSLQTRTVPKTTWSPSKKLSPMTMTVAPPDVQPSLGHTALMLGVTDDRKPKWAHVTHGLVTVGLTTERSWVRLKWSSGYYFINSGIVS